MSLKMIHWHQRQVPCKAQTFSVIETHAQRTAETRTIGHADCVHSIESKAGLFKRFTHNRIDISKVRAAGHFGNHAAMRLVHCKLRSHHVSQNVAAVLYQRRAGIIAGSVDTEDYHRGLSSSK